VFLKSKKDIINAMRKDIEGASDSTISWLANAFNVPLSNPKKVSERKVFDRSVRVPIKEEK